ncbi:MAG: adenosine kinase [Candidatus Hadarchaeales archaeon]
MNYDVLGIGTALLDHFVKVNDAFLVEHGLIKGATNFLPWKRFDEIYEKLEGEIFLTLPGDNARNVCEGIAYLGDTPCYLGCVGRDREGDFLLRELKVQGIRSIVERKAGRTGRIIVAVTPDGERTFLVNLGVGVNCTRLPEREICHSKFLYLTSITLAARGMIKRIAKEAISVAERKGTRVALSLESPPTVARNRQTLIKLLNSVDVLFSNEDELRALGKPVQWLLQKVELLYLKRGGKGSTVFTGGKRWQIPSFSRKTVDTTGAGDFYAAGVLHGLLHGKPPEKAGEIGARMAGKVVEHFGATIRNLTFPREKQSTYRSQR